MAFDVFYCVSVLILSILVNETFYLYLLINQQSPSQQNEAK